MLSHIARQLRSRLIYNVSVTMKIYKPTQIALATFLGSPIAGGALMAHNAKEVGKDGIRYWVISIGITATVLLLAFTVLPPWKGGNTVIPMLMALGMKYWANSTQGEILTGGQFPEATQASWWAVVGLGILFAVVMLVCLIAFNFLRSL
ncbi:hypothetical protein GALL_161470 [mine drainage metagenome]|uniref:Uncharacterized protein n=1 Tax=mine drainage metagenome TaxID=410659 RepID=A0A1J5SCC1_9ZZZZ